MKTYPVDLGSKHDIYRLTRLRFLFFIAFKWIFHCGIGTLIAKFVIYDKCLISKDCNVVAATYFSILSLACFSNCGLPIEKLAHVSIAGKGE